jgi:hypothetical protein
LLPLAIWLGSNSQFYFNGTQAAMYFTMDKWFEGSVGMNYMGRFVPNPVNLDPLLITSFALSMAVNALMTALIVFKILTVFLEVKPTLVERPSGGSLATRGTKLRSIIFIIIESGMALFAIQLVRVVLSCVPLNESTVLAFNLTIGINQMFNVIIISVYFYTLVLLITFTTRLGHRTDNNFGAGFNEIIH